MSIFSFQVVVLLVVSFPLAISFTLTFSNPLLFRILEKLLSSSAVFQCVADIRENIIDVLQTDGEPDEIGADPGGELLLLC